MCGSYVAPAMVIAKIMACIGTLVWALIKQAKFHNAAHIPQAFALLVTLLFLTLQPPWMIIFSA